MLNMKWCPKCPDTANLVLRIAVGVTFIMHGSQKVFGAFGGGGVDGVSGFLMQLGLPMPHLMAYLLAFTELFGGIGILLGAFTRLFAFLLSIVMLTAIFTVHLKNGFFADKGGFEYPFVILGSTLSLFFTGCHSWGLDCTIFKKWCSSGSCSK